MFEQMLAMMGLDKNKIEEMKTGVAEFVKRFEAMEEKVDFLHAKHSAPATFDGRLILEEKELSEKIAKLNDFFCTEHFAMLGVTERELLDVQIVAMRDYANTLNLRIAHFQNPQ